MAVSKQQRDDYERGVQDEKLGFFDRAVNDITINHPESRQYYMAREGEHLDDHDEERDEESD